MDSSGYKSISLSQGRLNQFAHGNSHESELNLPNIEEIARTIGFESRCVSGVEELSDAIDWMRSQSKSAVLVVKVSEKEDALPRLISRPNSAGIMETPPMNELSPIIQPSSGKQQ
jgi:thiamine pyrophosphate-dependent acetolactate synthase large subunit-like protein